MPKTVQSGLESLARFHRDSAYTAAIILYGIVMGTRFKAMLKI